MSNTNTSYYDDCVSLIEKMQNLDHTNDKDSATLKSKVNDLLEDFLNLIPQVKEGVGKNEEDLTRSNMMIKNLNTIDRPIKIQSHRLLQNNVGWRAALKTCIISAVNLRVFLEKNNLHTQEDKEVTTIKP